MATCAVCGYEAVGAFRFCPECGARMDGRAREQRKVVTVVFCDVAGSTALGESLDAEALRALPELSRSSRLDGSRELPASSVFPGQITPTRLRVEDNDGGDGGNGSGGGGGDNGGHGGSGGDGGGGH